MKRRLIQVIPPTLISPPMLRNQDEGIRKGILPRLAVTSITSVQLQTIISMGRRIGKRIEGRGTKEREEMGMEEEGKQAEKQEQMI